MSGGGDVQGSHRPACGLDGGGELADGLPAGRISSRTVIEYDTEVAALIAPPRVAAGAVTASGSDTWPDSRLSGRRVGAQVDDAVLVRMHALAGCDPHPADFDGAVDDSWPVYCSSEGWFPRP